MKPIRTALLVALALTAAWSCSTRQAAIPMAVTNLASALNNMDQDAFKALIWTGANDYTSIQNGSITVTNLVNYGGYQYKYYFSNIVVPTSGDSPLMVKADCTVQAYLSGTLISSRTILASDNLGVSANFEFVNGSTWFFMEDWKLSKLYLPGYATPMVKLPPFIEIHAP